MIKVIVKISLLVSCLAGTLFAFYTNSIQQDATSYFASMIDKHRRLDELAGKPRLILAGGSGTAFSVDSQLLEDSIGIPVVNLGLHAGLGLPFMLKQLRAIALPNDIILFTPEYFLSYGDDYTQFYVSDCFKPALQFMSFDSPFDYAIRRVNYFLRRIRNNLFIKNNTNKNERISDKTSVYFRKGFSDRGDLLSPINNKRAVEFEKLTIHNRDYSKEIGLMNLTAAELHKKDATLMVMYPALAESKFDKNAEVIAQYAANLRQVKLIKLIGFPENHKYPDSCFFDTPYHLTGPCRREYTLSILRDFRANRY